MLEKNIDIALVGKNYLSLILSLELLEKDMRVLLLDDERINYGTNFSQSFGNLEKSFLTTWGKDKGVGPLINLEKYLKREPVTIYFGKRRVLLGKSPSANLIELARKVPELISNRNGELFLSPVEEDYQREIFDKGVNSLCKRVGENIFRYKSIQNFDLEDFLTHSPQSLKDLFQIFSENWFLISQSMELKDRKFKNFLYIVRGYYQSRFSFNISKFELFHLLLCLLSPHYQLLSSELVKDLGKVNSKKGGQSKTTNIKDWFFYKRKPWSLELSSYEGVIKPNKISFLGGLPHGMPIEIPPKNNCYISLDIVIGLNEELDKEFQNQQFIFSSPEKMGTEFPMWIASVYQSRIEVKLLKRYEKGLKAEFLKSKVIKLLDNDWGHIFPNILEGASSFEMKLGKDLYLEDEEVKKSKKGSEAPFPKNLSFFDVSKMKKNQKLKNVTYFGPLKEGPLGLLSTLMELRDYQEFGVH